MQLLSDAFLKKLHRVASRLHVATQQKSKHQWQIARLVNAEWDRVDHEFEGEIRKEYFYAVVSHEINSVLPFPLCTETGETLRRWCEVARSYERMDTSMLEKVLSFDHFRVARSLAKLPRNENENIQSYDILLRTTQEGWTVEEMQNHFGDGLEPPNEYTRVVGWLDSLQTQKFDWVTTRALRDELQKLLSRIREIVDQAVVEQQFVR